MNKTDPLPNKLSALILLALKDLEWVEARPEIYKVNMNLWHTGTNLAPICGVCLAGAVIAHTFKMNHLESWVPSNFSANISDKLHAINLIREGRLEAALGELEEYLPDGVLRSVEICKYEDDPEAFKKKLLQIAKVLQKYNL